MRSHYQWQTSLQSPKMISQSRKPRENKNARTFVENEQFATAYNRTRKRQYLSLANGEVTPAARNLAIEHEAAVLVVAL
jgi:hypothetical protein